MLVLKTTIEGDKVVIQGLSAIAHELPIAVGRGFRRIGAGIFAEAHQLLSGPGGDLRKYRMGWRATGGYRKYDVKPSSPAGGYPVNVRSGNLRRLLGWVGPGESKSSGDLTFTAGETELVLFDSAAYASSIFEGKFSSAKYGPRDAVADGVKNFDQGNRMVSILDEEIQKEIDKK